MFSMLLLNYKNSCGSLEELIKAAETLPCQLCSRGIFSFSH